MIKHKSCSLIFFTLLKAITKVIRKYYKIHFKQTSVMIQASALKYYNVHGLYEAAMYVNGEV